MNDDGNKVYLLQVYLLFIEFKFLIQPASNNFCYH